MPAEMIIRLSDDGQVQVTGPIQNKILAYGMLEITRDAIRESADASKQLVQPATGMILPRQ